MAGEVRSVRTYRASSGVSASIFGVPSSPAVLEHVRDLGIGFFRAQEIVVQLSEIIIAVMIPAAEMGVSYQREWTLGTNSRKPYSRAGITVQQRRCTYPLLSISTTLAFVRVVCVTDGLLVKLKQGAQALERKVALRVLSLVDNTCRKSLFM